MASTSTPNADTVNSSTKLQSYAAVKCVQDVLVVTMGFRIVFALAKFVNHAPLHLTYNLTV